MDEIRVLLVDDNAEMRRSLHEQLSKQEGLRVAGECANGLEALEALGKGDVDVMVLDIIMPQMDGYALMEELRRQQPERMPRIIVATALGRDDFVRQLVSDIRPQCAQTAARCKAEQQRDHVGHFIAHKHPGDHIHKEMCHDQRDHIGVDQLCYAAGHKFKSTVQMCKNRI